MAQLSVGANILRMCEIPLQAWPSCSRLTHFSLRLEFYILISTLYLE
jgi:hypothetical protein